MFLFKKHKRTESEIEAANKMKEERIKNIRKYLIQLVSYYKNKLTYSKSFLFISVSILILSLILLLIFNVKFIKYSIAESYVLMGLIMINLYIRKSISAVNDALIFIIINTALLFLSLTTFTEVFAYLMFVELLIIVYLMVSSINITIRKYKRKKI